MGARWEHICETRGIVKMMLPSRREHHFEGLRACRMDDFGDFLFGEAFWSHFLNDFSEFGRPWGSEWESVGTTLADLLALFSRRVFDRFLIQFWEGPAAGAGVC